MNPGTLVGRQAEISAVRTRIDAARAGEGGALLVTAEAGMGKTALAEAVAADLAGVRIVRVGVSEAEQPIAFAGLAQLANGLDDVLATLPDQPREVLRGVLGTGPPRPADPLASASAVLALLTGAGEREPLVVLIDDAHWLDAETTMAVLLCARRLGRDPVLILATARTPEVDGTPLAGLPRLELTGLQDEDARSVVTRGRDVDPAVLARIVDVARGNALALNEIPAALGAARLSGSAPLPDPLPAGGHLDGLFAARAAALRPAARTALLVVAASTDGDAVVVRLACERLGSGREGLAEAEGSGLIEDAAPAAYRFRHPLVRSAVYGAADPAARRAAHAALAGALTDAPGDRAWQLARAQLEADEVVARELEEAGQAALARQGLSTAIGLLSRSAELSVTSGARVGRLTAAAQAAFMAGAFPTALELLGGALAERPDGVALARVEHLRGQVRMWLGPAAEAEAILVDAANAVAPRDSVLAAVLLTDVVFVAAALRADVTRAVEVARRAETLAARPDEEVRAALLLIGAFARFLNGAETFEEAHRTLDVLTRSTSVYSPFARWLAVGGQGLCWGDRLSDAMRYNASLAERLRAGGLAIAALYPELNIGMALVQAGRLSEADAVLSRVQQAAQETGQMAFVAATEAWLAYRSAIAGDAAAEEHARRALDAATVSGVRSSQFFAMHAQALDALGRERYDDALRLLRAIEEGCARSGMGNPVVVPFAADLAECLRRSGDVAGARLVAERVTAQAERIDLAAARAQAARARAVAAADAGTASEAFLQAIRFGEESDRPLDLARSRLLYGEHLGALGRAAEARRVLRDALVVFEQIGARPWAARTTGLLAGLGDARPEAPPDPFALLSPQEMQVALLVAEGLSNTEIGGRLFITRRTVEFHLTNTYRKLGLRGRTALAAEMSRRTPEGATT